MVDNFITENKMEAEQEAHLYIMILELQEKWEDILKFIESPLYSQLVPGSTAQACIPYLKKLGQWRRLNLLCKELLWDNQDRWDYYVPYFDSVFHLIKENDCNGESTADDTAEKCHEFICQIVESMNCGRTLRGPYLARLELWKRLAKDGDPTALLGSGLALCVQYLRVFANKPCAVPDLRPYLAMVARKEREEHARDFLTCLGFEENSEPDNVSTIFLFI
jgi:N-terminal acetyltransferase B complex non-catalytic subunit